MNKTISRYVVFAVVTFLFSCSHAVKMETVIDTPAHLYKNGLQKISANDLKTAESEFLRAIEIDKNSPEGYVGMAFVELNRSNYKSAVKQAEKGIDKNPGFADAYSAKGYALLKRRHGKNWFDEALQTLTKALEIDPENERALFYTAECYFAGSDYSKALELYAKTSGNNGIFSQQAKDRAVFTQKVIQAEPLSEPGRIIAESEKINRADLCVLLIEELKLKEVLKNRQSDFFITLFNTNFTLAEQPENINPEVRNNPAKTWILEIIALDIPYLDVYPDGNFYPDILVTKSLFAEVVQGALVVINNDSDLATKFIGLASTFNDVHAGYYAFNAIKLCMEKGIMDFPEDGYFKPGDTISGIDAILMLRTVQDILRQ